MKKTLALGLVALLAVGTVLADDDDDDGDRQSSRLPAKVNAAWKTECSACHMAYPPGLLPGKSWTALMQTLDHHFGSNASLDAATATEIRQFLVYASSDRDARPVAPSEARKQPIRITETAWFQHQHDELDPSVFRRKSVMSAANCMACHARADQGRFSEHEVRIPR